MGLSGHHEWSVDDFIVDTFFLELIVDMMEDDPFEENLTVQGPKF